MPKKEKRNNVDGWLDQETESKQNALENASEHYTESEPFTVNTLESLYGVESSFGADMGKRGSEDPAGHFQMKKATAERYHLKVTDDNDERFDLPKASVATTNQTKDNYKYFGKETDLGYGRKTIAVSNTQERKKFAIAAVNAGEGRIAEAQKLAKEAGADPTSWDDVKEYLVDAGAPPKQAQETIDYVDKVMKYEDEFAQKSKANKKRKEEEPSDSQTPSGNGHWITKDDRHIFIED